jgi:hypothetical protein
VLEQGQMSSDIRCKAWWVELHIGLHMQDLASRLPIAYWLLGCIVGQTDRLLDYQFVDRVGSGTGVTAADPQ